MIRKLIIILLSLTVVIFGSDGAMDLLEKVNQIIADFRSERQIDPRETVFAVRADMQDSKIVLRGEISKIELKNDLLLKIVDVLKIEPQDRLTVLPDPSLGEKIYGIVKVPVTNLMDGPRKTSQKSAVTQARMGELVTILKQSDEWYLSDGGFISWLGRWKNLISPTKQG